MTDLFYFTYNYGNADYYSGFGYANSGTYTTGQRINTGINEIGLNGFYSIDYLVTNVGSSSDVGNIYTYAYFDGDTSKKSYIPYYYSQGSASGTNGLGSEFDYISGAATDYDLFGVAYYEADAAGIAYYTFTYNYGDGDYYNGFFFGSDAAYEVGSSYDIYTGNNQAGYNGKYTITGVVTGYDSSYRNLLDDIYVYNYYDKGSDQSYTPYYYSLGLASGTNGLGGEIDYIQGNISGYSLFGQDYYVADAQSVAYYSFTYNYGNGDYYNGFLFASDTAYEVGSSYDSPTYSGNNQTGNNGKYTITGVLTGYDSSSLSFLNNVYVYEYYDADTSQASYTPYYYSLGIAAGTTGLGGEFDYIYGNVSGSSLFGQDYYEADAAGIAYYTFTYNYGNGDYYNGYLFASETAYQVGSTYDSYTGNNQTGNNGKYTITGVLQGLDSSYLSALDYVYVYDYYDADTSQTSYTPYYYNLGIASGTTGLGSEFDYIESAGLGFSLFGQDYYEADGAGISLYTFTYNYGNGDYYNGYVVASDIAYQVGSSYDSPTYSGNNQTGNNGKYTITSVTSGFGSSYSSSLGYVVVDTYYDADSSGQSYTPYYYSQGLASGTSYLGSEYDYIYGNLSGYSLFGQDYYEADATGIAVYSFIYNYGNGDYYEGFVYAADTSYRVGSTYDSYTGNNQTGFNGLYTITGVTKGLDSSFTTLFGQVYVASYYDAYSQATYTPLYYQTQATGTGGLGTEHDYIITSSGDLDLFGYDFYEFDNFVG